MLAFGITSLVLLSIVGLAFYAIRKKAGIRIRANLLNVSFSIEVDGQDDKHGELPQGSPHQG
jgi:hypothetical protein